MWLSRLWKTGRPQSVVDAKDAKTSERVRRRVEIAELETRALLDEWRDWGRMRAFAEELSPEARERLEMLRSELTVRGVRIPEKKRSAFSFEESSDALPSGGDVVEDTLPEWDEVVAMHIPQTVQYWEEQVRASSIASHNPARLAELLSLLRQAHGEQRLWDRQNGQTRDRLQVFRV